MPINNSRNAQLQQVSAWRSHDHSEPAHRLAAAHTPVAPAQSPALLLAGRVFNAGKRLRMVFASPEAKRRLMSAEELYNQWLHDYIREDGAPTDYHNREMPKEQFMRRVMDDGEVCVEYRVGGISHIFGWESSKTYTSSQYTVPAYTDTIDKSIMQEDSPDGERLRNDLDTRQSAIQALTYGIDSLEPFERRAVERFLNERGYSF